MTLLIATDLDFRLHKLVRRFEDRAISAALRLGSHQISHSGLMIFSMDLVGSERTLQAIVKGFKVSRTKGGISYFYFAPGTALAASKTAPRVQSGPTLFQQLRGLRAPRRPKKSAKYRW